MSKQLHTGLIEILQESLIRLLVQIMIGFPHIGLFLLLRREGGRTGGAAGRRQAKLQGLVGTEIKATMLRRRMVDVGREIRGEAVMVVARGERGRVPAEVGEETQAWKQQRWVAIA